jgi:3-oxo-5-alpha-steroid 4-dehydrogenase 3
LFFTAWFKQNECHRYLASLKKYTLPDEGMFKYIVCPHYTCECVIYLAISFMAAPRGSTFNMCTLCGLAFVMANLGATAYGTQRWYAGKFGADKVINKWRMVPGVF